MYVKKIAALVLSLLLMASVLSGCKKSSSDSDKPTDVSAGDVSFPLKEKITLKAWCPFGSTLMKSYNDNAVYKELEKRTNIHMDFIHPVGDATQNFNLAIASNDLPDLFFKEPAYPGGPDKAIEDQVFVKLNDYIDKYAPDYKKVLESNPEIARQTKTDAGNIYCFNCIQLGDEPAWCGLITRKDWLDDLGLAVPETIDDWHNVLTQFKQKKNAQVPLLFNGLSWRLATSSAIVSAYDTTNDFFNQDGKVKYGYLEPGYKQFLTTMNQWYKEGLIDKDFNTRDDKTNDAMFTSGKAGAFYEQYGEFGGYNNAGKKVDPKFTMIGVANPSLNKGQAIHFRQTNFFSKGDDTSITTANKHIPETVAWLNYAYTDDGFLLYNYGVEGQAWTWKDGPVADIDKPFFPPTLRDQNKHPEYTDFMLKNPDGYAFWDIEDVYKVHENAYLRDPMANGGMDGDVAEAMTNWSKPGNDWVMPKITNNDEENKRDAPIMNDINTYISEMQVKFILGQEPLSNYDQFTSKIKSMGIDQVIADKQAALDRYNSRK